MTHPVLHPGLHYRRDIDGLRAVAILPVLAYHVFPDFLKGGFVGVDVFFVISGYLISGIILTRLAAGTFGFADFYARRARRIFPSLAVTLVSVWVFAWFLFLPIPFTAVGKHILAGAGFASNLVFWSESGYFDTASDSKPLLHLWSLGVEEQFYLLWPLFLVLAWRQPRARLSIVIALTAASFFWNVVQTAGNAAAAFYSPATRLWELSLGGVLAYLVVCSQRDTWASALPGVDRRRTMLLDVGSITGFLLIAVAVVVVDARRAFPGYWALLPVIGAALLLSSGPQAWINRHVLSATPMVRIGLISFQLYLWHWPVLVFTKAWYSRQTGVEELPVSYCLAVLAASFVLASLTYRYIDMPMRTGRWPTAKAWAATFVLAAIGAGGYWTMHQGGFARRFPAVIGALASNPFDYASAYREGSCFLRPEQDFSQFSGCVDSSQQGLRKVVLWGDSHAAHLYPGFKRVAPGNFQLAQYTASACPPLLDIDIPGRPHCRDINNRMLASIDESPPDHLVLAALFSGFEPDLLARTLVRLRKTGTKHITVIGPVPRWSRPLGELASNAATASSLAGLPQRLQLPHWPDTVAADAIWRSVAESNGATFISTIAILCTDQGMCLVRARDDDTSIVAWDNAHLTTAGSEYLVSRFPASLIGE